MEVIKVTLEDGRHVSVYATSYEEAILKAESEFGIKAYNARDPYIEVVEYHADGKNIVACYDNGREEIIATAENESHAQEKANALNEKI